VVVRRVVEKAMPGPGGICRAIAYQDTHSGADCMALVLGDMEASRGHTARPPLVRVLSERDRVEDAADLRRAFGNRLPPQGGLAVAVLLCLGGHDFGIGRLGRQWNKALRGLDWATNEMDGERWPPGPACGHDQSSAMLQDLGARRVRLLTNDMDQARGLSERGIEVSHVIPLFMSTGAGPFDVEPLTPVRQRRALG
jgi:3,4-dihydroxy 2-butanone 4-phosphate synthase/GTP cyclohydrolase II